VETGLFCGIGFAATLQSIQRSIGEKKLPQEQPQVAANLEKELFNYLKAVEGKTYRSVLSRGGP